MVVYLRIGFAFSAFICLLILLMKKDLVSKHFVLTLKCIVNSFTVSAISFDIALTLYYCVMLGFRFYVNL